MNRVRIISLIGRPNVGKSTIYNRLMGNQNLNITHDRPGVTRDRHYGLLPMEGIVEDEEANTDFILYLVDTGGFYPDLKDHLLVHEVGKAPQQAGHAPQFLSEEERKRRDLFQRLSRFAEMSIEESDLVLLVVDVREGLSPYDELILGAIRRQQKDFLILVNKADSDKQEPEVAQFYALGVDEERLMPLSAAHGKGFGDLKEKIGNFLQNWKQEEISEQEQGDQRELQDKGLQPREQVIGTLSIVGAPNVGKSTLLNRILGSERALVAPVPGTTVDPINGYVDLYFGPKVTELFRPKSKGRPASQEDDATENGEGEIEGEEFSLEMAAFEDVEGAEQEDAELETADENTVDELSDASEDNDEMLADAGEEDQALSQAGQEDQGNQVEKIKGSFWRSVRIVDTAGIRKKKLITEFVESQSVYRALRTVDESDVVVYLVDATKGIGHQDSRMCDIILEKGKSLILCFNKMGCVEKQWKNPRAKREWWEKMTLNIPWLDFCQVLPLSAKTGGHLKALKEAIKKTLIIRHRKIPTGRLNSIVHQLVEKNPIIPKHSHGKRLKIRYVSMVKSGPPPFLMFSNLTENIPPHYRRYLVNGIRREFGLVNTPIHLIFRSSSEASVPPA